VVAPSESSPVVVPVVVPVTPLVVPVVVPPVVVSVAPVVAPPVVPVVAPVVLPVEPLSGTSEDTVLVLELHPDVNAATRSADPAIRREIELIPSFPSRSLAQRSAPLHIRARPEQTLSRLLAGRRFSRGAALPLTLALAIRVE
jgi:hypothetical protein